MAVQFHLKQFDGPLDLLLQLVDKAKIDLKDIFVSQITEQYIEIVRSAPDLDMDEASEFISMAALLIEIKSRRLLPKPPKAEEEEEDPEQVLLARLEAYKQLKETAGSMAQFEKSALQVFGKLPEEYPLPPPVFELEGLSLQALWEALLRVQNRKAEQPSEILLRFRDIRRDAFTVEACMENIESHLAMGETRFTDLFSDHPDKEEAVTLFIALLEILKLGKAHVCQNAIFGEITLMPGRKTPDAEPADTPERPRTRRKNTADT